MLQLLYLILIIMSSSTTTITTTRKQHQPKNKMLIDIGINLTHRQFHRDRDEVIQRASDAGIHCLILTGTSVQASKEAKQFCETFHSSSSVSAESKMHVFSTTGVHPHDAKRCNDETTITELEQLAQSSHVVAIGECGLDYDRNFSPPDVQRKWFTKQLDLAIDLKMPVFSTLR